MPLQKHPSLEIEGVCAHLGMYAASKALLTDLNQHQVGAAPGRCCI